MKPKISQPYHRAYEMDAQRVISVFGTTVIVKASSEETDGAYCVLETTFPPHYRKVLPHWHRKKSESFYVLDGTLTFTLGDQTFIAHCGAFVLIPPQTVHHYWNSTASPVTFLTVSAPGGLEKYMGELSETFRVQAYDAELASQIATRYDQFSPEEENE